jgi:hypothetical protein
MDFWGSTYLVFALGCLVAAGGLLLVWRHLRAKAAASATWPTAPGTVTQSRIDAVPDREGDTLYGPVVQYGYRVGGMDYTAERIGWGGREYNTKEKAEAVCARYPAGQPVAVYYDPQAPSKAVLEPSAKGGMSWAPVLAAICGVLGVVFVVAHFVD